MERERTKKCKEYTRLIEQPHQNEKLEIIKSNLFLSKLGDYDLFELVLGCSLKKCSQSSTIHTLNEKVDKIGYVVSGKIKLTFNMGHTMRREKSVNWVLNEKDWIGLEEFLWQGTYQSTGEVSSIGAVILWIPRELFAGKFNAKTNN